ncbi:transglutaminase family protein [Maribacter sp. MMG018]|uniref:transglutaminase-like domain-containing protein n=1 Tax=Maribacter sp. MMG018 TaxID=2822688 RepID=UPI001B3912E3|nr:transglutaminase family protein [Maribacter sp. MMG018]MBQ4915533.1 transglutaminase family protein [Maribacter sp. MMG018]
MSKEYTVTYIAENTYENWVDNAFWQFLIIPEENETQDLVSIDFSNSIHAINQFSINGYGFNTIRLHSRKKFKQISFEATFKLLKSFQEPTHLLSSPTMEDYYDLASSIDFKVDFEKYLRATRLTSIPHSKADLFQFDPNLSIYENLMSLNNWVYIYIHYTTGVTDVHTTLDEIIEKRRGVCQDFTHLFCAISKQNGIPARYVSGYLNHESGFFGDSQMHAWAETYIPTLGWIGFDPTNNILANKNHIKVCHGKDYDDCSPLKGVIYTQGSNKTSHSVTVVGQQKAVQQ